MSKQAVGSIVSWLSQCVRMLVPEWFFAMFAGRPLARTISFDAGSDAPKKSVLPLKYLTHDIEKPIPKRFAPLIDAHIPSDMLLARSLTLPKGAKGKIAAAAALDLRQRTPFNPAEIYWQLEQPVHDGDMLRVRQWVAKKTDIDRWRDRLTKRGYRVRQVKVEDTQLQAPLVDFSEDIAPYQRVISLFNLALFTISALLLLAYWLYPAWIAQQQTMQLQKELSALQGQAVQMRREIEALRGKDAERTALLDLILRRPLLVETLRDLTVALDDKVWISELSFSPQRAVLTAETSGSAAQTAINLSEKRSFGDPRLSGTVQKAANGSERFELTVNLGEVN